MAQDMPGHQRSFQQLNLCQWVNTKKVWVSKDAWDACATDHLDLGFFEGKDVYIGCDLSTRNDLTALSLVHVDENEEAWILPFAYCPEEGVRRRSRIDRVDYDAWAQQGFLTATPGNAVDYDYIAQQIREIAKIANVKGVGYDPWNATQFALGLQAEGSPMVEVRQGYRTMSEPCKALEALILGKRLHHPAHPVLDWCIGNTIVDTDPAGNIKPSKASSTERIDCVAALVTALALQVNNADAGTGVSMYESQGIECV